MRIIIKFLPTNGRQIAMPINQRQLYVRKRKLPLELPILYLDNSYQVTEPVMPFVMQKPLFQYAIAVDCAAHIKNFGFHCSL
ncbi:hypothetical protein [Nostoc sp. UHCC 0251]|uniref:hypothetical protein n=1 Tax=Nostoc sp. UHCC 0251 TaxID=3110240 RepID=UPI002B208E24|nr:hypothetical protein [Nostoc sp. UHCC 0251]MEA5627698.1 hypothetical protein [Nostoc sp. UHCC 0251]